MKRLNSKAHGYLDFVMMATLFLAPIALGLEGAPRTLSYVLGAVLAAVVVFTAYPFGFVKALPFQMHGALELMLVPALAAIPWLAGFDGVETARNYYLALSATVLVVWSITDYTAVSLTVKSRASFNVRESHA